MLISVPSQFGTGCKCLRTYITRVRLHFLVDPVVGLQMGFPAETFTTLLTAETFDPLVVNKDMLVQLIATAEKKTR
jgi:hypothetical protein